MAFQSAIEKQVPKELFEAWADTPEEASAAYETSQAHAGFNGKRGSF